MDKIELKLLEALELNGIDYAKEYYKMLRCGKSYEKTLNTLKYTKHSKKRECLLKRKKMHEKCMNK